MRQLWATGDVGLRLLKGGKQPWNEPHVCPGPRSWELKPKQRSYWPRRQRWGLGVPGGLEGLQLAGSVPSRGDLCVMRAQKYRSDTHPHVGEFPTPAAGWPYNSTQFQHDWSGHSIRAHRLRSQSHKIAPTSDPNSSPGCYLCFCPTLHRLEVPRTPHLEFD